MASCADVHLDSLKEEILETIQRPEHNYSWNSCLREAQSVDVVLDLLKQGQFTSTYQCYSNTSKEKHSSIVVKHIKPFPKDSRFPNVVVDLSYELKVLRKLEDFCLGINFQKMYLHIPSKNFAFLEKLPNEQSLQDKVLKEYFLAYDMVKDVVENVAKIHQASHIQYNDMAYLQDLEAQLQTHHQKDVNEQRIFVIPYQKDSNLIDDDDDDIKQTLERINEEYIVISEVKKLKDVFHSSKECLIHGNLHFDSINISSSENLYLSNFEFAHIGPASYDIACLLVNYITLFHYHLEHIVEPEIDHIYSNSLIEMMKVTGQKYSELMKLKSENKFWSEVAGFTGCEIIKRLVEPFHSELLQDCKHARRDMLEVGIRLLQAYRNIATIDKLLLVGFMMAY
ncbi:uncharacterized protein LOC115216774 [Argonauta hians]